MMEAVPGQWGALVAAVGVSWCLGAVAGRNSWPPAVAGHGKCWTWIADWADCGFDGNGQVTFANSPGTSEAEEKVERCLAAWVNHGSTCSRSELAC